MMLQIKPIIARFLGVNQSTATEKVFCCHCSRNDDFDASYGAQDGRVFVGYRVGKYLIARVSRGKGKAKWFITDRGGMLCENSHWTGICNGHIYHIRDISRQSNTLDNYQRQYSATKNYDEIG